ncbi:hypothetical protein BS78_05G092800 [Paspalum vaginatum]|nr:hypothetical protein BS78_05G092800 [Paspalum vaginatum]
MLFLEGADGRPRYTAQEALALVVGASGTRAWAAGAGRWAKLFHHDDWTFGDATLRNTVALLLVPYYDLATAAPFVFSRDARRRRRERQLRLPPAPPPAPWEAWSVRSVDGLTIITAASGGVAAMGTRRAAGVTCVGKGGSCRGRELFLLPPALRLPLRRGLRILRPLRAALGPRVPRPAPPAAVRTPACLGLLCPPLAARRGTSKKGSLEPWWRETVAGAPRPTRCSEGRCHR